MTMMHKIDIYHPSFSTATSSTGLSWPQLFALAINFGQKYGPELIKIIVAVAAAVKTGNVSAIAGLVVQYGPEIYAMAAEIAAMFGVQLPPIPGAPAAVEAK
jgi:hypothetical protein